MKTKVLFILTLPLAFMFLGLADFIGCLEKHEGQKG